jgi:hypothetical protein
MARPPWYVLFVLWVWQTSRDIETEVDILWLNIRNMIKPMSEEELIRWRDKTK